MKQIRSNMSKKKEMKVSATIKRIGGSLVIPIPSAIVEMLDIQEGDVVKIPFLEFEKVEPEKDEKFESYEPIGTKEIVVNLKSYGPKTITQEEVIEVLEKYAQERGIQSYRSVYVLWNGNRYSVKGVFAKILGNRDFNTVQAENYLKKLGFQTGR